MEISLVFSMGIGKQSLVEVAWVSMDCSVMLVALDIFLLHLDPENHP